MYFQMAYTLAKKKKKKIQHSMWKKCIACYDCFSLSKKSQKYLSFVSGIACSPLSSDHTSPNKKTITLKHLLLTIAKKQTKN